MRTRTPVASSTHHPHVRKRRAVVSQVRLELLEALRVHGRSALPVRAPRRPAKVTPVPVPVSLSLSDLSPSKSSSNQFVSLLSARTSSLRASVSLMPGDGGSGRTH